MTVEKYPKLKKGVRMSPLDLRLPEPAYLIQLPNGKPMRVSTYIFQILSLMNGERPISQIASAVSSMQERRISRREIIWIIEEKLKPLGLLDQQEAPSSQTSMEVCPGRKLLTIAPERMRSVTGLLHNLFTLPAVLLLPLIVVVNIWLFQLYDFSILRVSFAEMTGIDYVLTMILVYGCILFHEIGHLTACRHYGCVHGEIRVKVSLPAPALLADVTDAWRLTRFKRAIVDLGGLWFQILCIPVLYLIYAVTASFVPVFGIFLLDLGILWVMIPTPKSDGYWFLLDLLGVSSLDQENYRRSLSAYFTSHKKILAAASLLLLAGLFTVLITLEAISIWPTIAGESLTKIAQSIARADLLNSLDTLVKLLAPTFVTAGLVLLNLRLIKSARFIAKGIRGSVGKN